ncbi:MAG: DEAD/DEAH box helicase family protein [Deltaproteobacteria bacterium]|nr:DEAD/DEAH box helicase family protein [Deltaproteobacteria bacterium]
MGLASILQSVRNDSESNRHVGDRFERLIANFIRTYPVYEGKFSDIWLWNDFPYRRDLHEFGTDFGIDLILKAWEGDYWAVQCKCYQENAQISQASVAGFLAASGKFFHDDAGEEHKFSDRLWISTTDKWSKGAQEMVKQQSIEFHVLSLASLGAADVDWDKLDVGVSGIEARLPRKTLMEHQIEALDKAFGHFEKNDRGLLVMACGTGKTLLSLKIAEQEILRVNGNDGRGGLIVFFAPSIALIGQTLKEWAHDAVPPIFPVCVCSDADISRAHYKKAQDINMSYLTDLPLPAVTDPKIIRQRLIDSLKDYPDRNRVIFSTYQSIDKISDTLKSMRASADIVVCDEAHRTTGVDFANPSKPSIEISHFRKVHDNKVIPASKRLYMTATPRIFGDKIKTTVDNKAGVLCSMDDESLYGPEFHRLGFGEAVDRDLLSDYKVLVFAINRRDIPDNMQDAGSDEIDADDVTRLIGCVNALSKNMTYEDKLLIDSDPGPMRKAVAFCQTIAKSKAITDIFNQINPINVMEKFLDSGINLVNPVSKHIDGNMGACVRDGLMSWLKSDPGENDCNILTNVRCMSEGLDITTLDAVMFLSAKNSQIEVVQSVGRVMRKAPGKTYGYIIIPIVIPAHVAPEHVLDNNKTFETIWTVLNALKAHDDRFQSVITKIQFNKVSKTILVGGIPPKKEGEGGESADHASQISKLLAEEWEKVSDLNERIYAKLVKKVGNRHEMALWAADVAQIADGFKNRITEVVTREGEHKDKFKVFLNGLQETLNPSVDSSQAVEMLAQHLITQPVFDALFGNYVFTKVNPVSKSLESMIKALDDQGLEKDKVTLTRFFHTVRNQVSGIDSYEDRQKIIINLYDNFFDKAMPGAVKQLGIVYTPYQAVDFINRSVAKVLENEFGRSITDPHVHILDPFAGTGTFLVRMIQSGLLGSGKTLEYKYHNDLHANEIILLSYYIANINIENAYHEAQKNFTDYQPFEGICLTDTFQIFEEGGGKLLKDVLELNSKRVNSLKKQPIVVILGNPPYSSKQDSVNDNLQNIKYPDLDGKLTKSYAESKWLEKLHINNVNSLHDSYIKAFRWATDRLENQNQGIIGFITNTGWVDGNSNAIIRKCFSEDFSKIYVFNLRGDCNIKGLRRKLECENIFGQGTKTPVAITLLVKDTRHTGPAEIFYHDIGDKLTRENKLNILADSQDIYNPDIEWEKIEPNKDFDWINQRNYNFSDYMVLGDKSNKNNLNTFFTTNYSQGLNTARNSWCYNFSSQQLMNNIKTTIDYYNATVSAIGKLQTKKTDLDLTKEIDFDSSKFSWGGQQQKDLLNSKQYKYSEDSLYLSLYRPFTKSNCYFNRSLNDRIYLLPQLFPTNNHKNLVICTQGKGVKSDFSCIMTSFLPDLELVPHSQCFPLYHYEENTSDKFESQLIKSDKVVDGYIRHDAVTDYIHKTCNDKYGFPDSKTKISKTDIFFYVYGILHSEDYKTTFASNLKKEMPRIPLLDTYELFQAFVKAGRDLARLHVEYESVEPYQGVEVTGTERGNFIVDQMKFANKEDKSVIIYNPFITIKSIPSDAYDYIVNGNSAIEWIMDRYEVTIHPKTKIRNDPNDWAKEHNHPKYILDLLLKVITVSLETAKIVESLPKLTF